MNETNQRVGKGGCGCDLVSVKHNETGPNEREASVLMGMAEIELVTYVSSQVQTSGQLIVIFASVSLTASTSGKTTLYKGPNIMVVS